MKMKNLSGIIKKSLPLVLASGLLGGCLNEEIQQIKQKLRNYKTHIIEESKTELSDTVKVLPVDQKPYLNVDIKYKGNSLIKNDIIYGGGVFDFILNAKDDSGLNKLTGYIITGSELDTFLEYDKMFQRSYENLKEKKHEFDYTLSNSKTKGVLFIAEDNRGKTDSVLKKFAIVSKRKKYGGLSFK